MVRLYRSSIEGAERRKRPPEEAAIECALYVRVRRPDVEQDNRVAHGAVSFHRLRTVRPAVTSGKTSRARAGCDCDEPATHNRPATEANA